MGDLRSGRAAERMPVPLLVMTCSQAAIPDALGTEVGLHVAPVDARSTDGDRHAAERSRRRGRSCQRAHVVVHAVVIIEEAVTDPEEAKGFDDTNFSPVGFRFGTSDVGTGQKNYDHCGRCPRSFHFAPFRDLDANYRLLAIFMKDAGPAGFCAAILSGDPSGHSPKFPLSGDVRYAPIATLKATRLMSALCQ